MWIEECPFQVLTHQQRNLAKKSKNVNEFMFQKTSLKCEKKEIMESKIMPKKFHWKTKKNLFDGSGLLVSVKMPFFRRRSI